jgi:hypothetical protein
MGRKSTYSTEIADRICERLANGESLRKMCADPEMPDRITVLRWIESGDHADFASKYARARQYQADAMDDLILEAAEGCDQQNAAAQRVKIDAYKWRAAKLAPKVYGDKIETTVQGPNGGPVEFTEIRRVIVDGSPKS